MPKVDVALDAPVVRDFRVEQVAGLFDVAIQERSRLELSVHLPAIEGPGSDWSIGVIAGPSGSNKTSIAAAAYGQRFLASFDWPADAAIVSAFPADLTMDAITGALNAVGFSSPPAWVLPYRCLSTGQRMRCDLARALLLGGEVIAFDEFTSVVDRQVGRFASAAVSKAIRKRRVPLKRFVAVTCHLDVIDWLEPDWVLDTETRALTAASGTLTRAALPRGCLHRRRGGWKRPAIEIEVGLCDTSAWPVFRPHHYLSAALHPASRCYLATWEGAAVAFCATLPNAGHKGRRIVHRLVVLPDYQGMGIGLRLLDAVAAHEHGAGYCVSIRTSYPALIGALKTGGPGGSWRVAAVARGGSQHHVLASPHDIHGLGVGRGSQGRSVVSFRYRPPAAGE
jgi:GNAT superfamily N-acetyltransferase